MSKKYDEYLAKVREGQLVNKVVPMIPETDLELDKEIRDRVLISYVTEYTRSNGYLPTYEETISMVDGKDNPGARQEYKKFMRELRTLVAKGIDPQKALEGIPTVSEEVKTEFRDRQIIQYIGEHIRFGDPTYGEIVAYIDGNDDEIKYEEEKKHSQVGGR